MSLMSQVLRGTLHGDHKPHPGDVVDPRTVRRLHKAGSPKWQLGVLQAGPGRRRLPVKGGEEKTGPAGLCGGERCSCPDSRPSATTGSPCCPEAAPIGARGSEHAGSGIRSSDPTCPRVKGTSLRTLTSQRRRDCPCRKQQQDSGQVRQHPKGSVGSQAPCMPTWNRHGVVGQQWPSSWPSTFLKYTSLISAAVKVKAVMDRGG